MCDALSNYLLDWDWTFTAMLDEMFDLEEEGRTEANQDWTRFDALCLECILRFVREHVVMWLYQKEMIGQRRRVRQISSAGTHTRWVYLSWESCIAIMPVSCLSFNSTA